MGILEPEMLFLDLDDARWRALTATDPQAHVFHQPTWAKLLAECYGYRPFVIGVRSADNSIGAGLPAMEIGSLLTGRRWTSLPFTDHCAPLHYGAESLGCLADGLVHLSREQSTPRIELRCELPSQPGIRFYSHQVLHMLPLCRDSDSVASRFHSTHRRNIKVAQKRGVHIERGEKREHLKAFYRLHLRTRRRQGIPIQPWRFFDLLGSSLIEKGLGFVLLAYKDDECLAAAVFLHWQRTLTYKYGASAEKGLDLRPNNLLFWTAILWGCDNGYTRFDMGRTDLDNTGLRAFKTGWGADEMPLTYSVIGSAPPALGPGRPTRIARTVIRNSPGWVCRVAGELLYKHFG